MESNLQISFDLIGFYVEIKRNAHFFLLQFLSFIFCNLSFDKESSLKLVKNQLGK